MQICLYDLFRLLPCNPLPPSVIWQLLNNSQRYIQKYGEDICDIPSDQIFTKRFLQWFVPEEKRKRFFLY